MTRLFLSVFIGAAISVNSASGMQPRGNTGPLPVEVPGNVGDALPETDNDWIRLLVRNADTMDEDVEQCYQRCTETFQIAEAKGNDGVVAAALMQRSAAALCLWGVEKSLDDFERATALFPVMAPQPLQLLFSRALFTHQQCLGARNTTSVPIPPVAELTPGSSPEMNGVRLRLLCDLIRCREEEGADTFYLMQRSTVLLAMTNSEPLLRRFDLLNLEIRLQNDPPEQKSELLPLSEKLLQPETFATLPRALQVDVLRFSANLNASLGNKEKAIEHINEARATASSLKNKTLSAHCETELMELAQGDDQWHVLETGLRNIHGIVSAINCPELLGRLLSIGENLPRDVSAQNDWSALHKTIQARRQVLIALRNNASIAIENWNDLRIHRMLDSQSRQISAEQFRADEESRRSLLHARIGFGIFCALAAVLLRERGRLRKINLRIEEEMRNSEKARQEKEQIELRLAQTERLESLGALAGGIAHDFNNLLVGVIGNADLLRHLEAISPAGIQCLDGIIRSAETAAGLSHKMLAYAGKQPARKQVVDLNDSINRMLPLLRSGLGSKFVLEFRPAISPLLTEGDSEQLDQILMNLVTNAAQAMPDAPGTIVIKTGFETMDAVPINTPTFGNRKTGGQFVWFEVQDSGKGIPEGDLARVFEPFFTTKGKSTGHGFGLAVVYGHINRHNGLIQISTKAGQGCRFRILLPLSTQPLPSVAKSPVEPVRTPLPKVLRVVAVDDQQQILDVVQRTVGTIGGETKTFASSTDALEYITENRNISCLLLDMMMPVLDGPSMLEELAIKGIEIPIVLMSGYSTENLGDFPKMRAVKGVLQKPFKPEELITVLTDALADHKMTYNSLTRHSPRTEGGAERHAVAQPNSDPDKKANVR